MTARMREVEVEGEQRPLLRFVCFFASLSFSARFTGFFQAKKSLFQFSLWS
jgi:hypothetical protein